MINEGDTVTVYWTIGEASITGVVKHSPRDVGDLWFIETDNGHIVAFNPNCSNFEFMRKEATDAK